MAISFTHPQALFCTLNSSSLYLYSAVSFFQYVIRMSYFWYFPLIVDIILIFDTMNLGINNYNFIPLIFYDSP